MRIVFLVDHGFPPTPDDMAAAAAVGAPEVICGIPPALAALGIASFGRHEIEEAPRASAGPSADQVRAALLAAGMPGEQIDALFAAAATFG